MRSFEITKEQSLTHSPLYAKFIYIALPCCSQNVSNVLNMFCSVVFFLLLSICNSGLEGPQVTVINGIVKVDDIDPWVYLATDLKRHSRSLTEYLLASVSASMASSYKPALVRL